MNKLIKELALQSGLEMCSCGCDMPTRQSTAFAKLIIQECVDEVSRYHSTTIDDAFIEEQMEAEHYEQWDYIKGNNTGYNYAVTKITEGLKKHFGVAE